MKNEPEWIEWKCETGKCPVPSGHDVEVEFFDETIGRDNAPEDWNWYNDPCNLIDRDIVAYRDWTEFNKQQEENKMKGCQLKQRNHPAAALAEQIDSEQKKYQEATVADLIDDLDNEQKRFALGYLLRTAEPIKRNK